MRGLQRRHPRSSSLVRMLLTLRVLLVLRALLLLLLLLQKMGEQARDWPLDRTRDHTEK